MSTISPKEKRLLMIALTVILYGIAFICYNAQTPNWKKEHKILQTAENKLRDERALIAARADWQEQYAHVRELMPSFPHERDMKTYWQRMADDIAERTSLTLTRRQAKDEIEVGDVYELPLECQNWEGSLDALVRFLYELGTEEGAMLDIRQLYIGLAGRNAAGSLKGRFTLYCAYMRGN